MTAGPPGGGATGRVAATVLAIVILAAGILLSFGFPPSARADIAPPDQPPGANLLPGGEGTQVRMLAESVLIDVLGNTPAGSLGQARVTARFRMQNLGDADEKMAVRFPLTFWDGRSDGFDRYPEIKDFSARVQGRSVAVRRAAGAAAGDPDARLPWAEFEATFPAGEEVLVEVSYLVEGAGEYPFISFKYILESGAGWRDTIGAADLTLRLPYPASEQNVIFAEQIGWSQTTPGGDLSGREVRWNFLDFEPGAGDNLEVSLVMPAVWKKVLAEQANTTRDPGDGEAWGRLGKLYKEIVSYRRGLRQDPGGLELYRLAVSAYENALALRPKDALWHAGFADLLYRNYYWGEFFKPEPDHSEMLRALDELRLSLELDADNVKARELLDDIPYALPEALRQEGDGYVFLWLTATPTARPTRTATAEGVIGEATPTRSAPTDTPQAVFSQTPTRPPATPASHLPTATARPASQAVPTAALAATQITRETEPPMTTPAAQTGGGLQICGVSIGLIAAIFYAVWLWWSRRTVA